MTEQLTPTTIELVVAANALARYAHADQTDKLGEPYINHCQRVARRVRDEREQVVAWLHDIVEDTEITLEALALGFPEWVVDAVDAITRRHHITTTGARLNEHGTDYYKRVRANPTAYAVKLADIADNTDPRRLLRLPAEEMMRLMEKYAGALDALGVPC